MNLGNSAVQSSLAELMNTMHTPTCRMTLTTHKPEEQLALFWFMCSNKGITSWYYYSAVQVSVPPRLFSFFFFFIFFKLTASCNNSRVLYTLYTLHLASPHGDILYNYSTIAKPGN